MAPPAAPTITSLEVDESIGRVRIKGTIPAGTTEYDVYRTGPSGVIAYVRGARDVTLPGPAGIDVVDYEAPFGVPVDYVLVARNGDGETLSSSTALLIAENGALFRDGAVEIWEGTTNLILNGSLEASASYWSAWGDPGVTLERVDDWATHGDWCGKLTTTPTGATDGALQNVGAGAGLVPLAVYTWSVDVRPDVDLAMRLQAHSYNGGVGTGIAQGPLVECPAGETTRLSMTFTLPASTNNVYCIVALAGPALATSFRFDAGQLEQKPLPTPYVHTAGGSPASRVNARVRADSLNARMSLEQGWAVLRVRHGWTAADNEPSSPFPFYLNVLASTPIGDRVSLTYSPAGNELYASKHVNTVAIGNVTTPLVVVDGELHTLAVRWTPNELGLSIDGAAFVTVDAPGIPIGTIDNVDFGSYVGGNQADVAMLWAALGTGELDDAAIAAMHEALEAGEELDVPMPSEADPVAVLPMSSPQYFGARVDLESADDWLVDLDDVRNTGPVLVESFTELEYLVPQGVHRILGRRTPVVTSDLRWTPSGRLVLLTQTVDEARRVRDALGSSSPLLLRSTFERGVGNMYLLPSKVVEQRMSRLATEPARRWQVDVTEIDRPDPSLYVPTSVTYSEVAALFSTYAELELGRADYGELLYSREGIDVGAAYSREPAFPPRDV